MLNVLLAVISGFGLRRRWLLTDLRLNLVHLHFDSTSVLFLKLASLFIHHVKLLVDDILLLEAAHIFHRVHDTH